MTDEELAAIEALANAATPGPWTIGGPYPSTSVIKEVSPGVGYLGGDVCEPPEYAGIAYLDDRREGDVNPQAQADAAFIAAARAAVPKLIAEVRRLQEQVNEWKKACDFAEKEARNEIRLLHEEMTMERRLRGEW